MDREAVQKGTKDNSEIKSQRDQLPFLDAIDAFRRGEIVCVSDDAGRENECDLVVCAATMSEEQMRFMLEWTTGIICVAMEAKDLRKKQLPLMVEVDQSTDSQRTAFTVSVDARGSRRVFLLRND